MQTNRKEVIVFFSMTNTHSFTYSEARNIIKNNTSKCIYDFISADARHGVLVFDVSRQYTERFIVKLQDRLKSCRNKFYDLSCSVHVASK